MTLGATRCQVAPLFGLGAPSWLPALVVEAAPPRLALACARALPVGLRVVVRAQAGGSPDLAGVVVESGGADGSFRCVLAGVRSLPGGAAAPRAAVPPPRRPGRVAAPGASSEDGAVVPLPGPRSAPATPAAAAHAPPAPARRRCRRPARLSARLETSFGRDARCLQRGFVLDLSERGIGMTSRAALEAGEALTLQVPLPTGRIAQLCGRVVWARRDADAPLPWRAGLQLTAADEHWRAFVAQRRERAAAAQGASAVLHSRRRSTG